MNISEPFIRRPVMTTLLMVTVLVLGISSFLRLPISNLPDVDFPVITVKAVFPGANPETMANTVATPLEKEFMTIPGLRSITSSNTLGSTSIIMQFEINIDIDLASVDVEAAIVRAKARLPPDLPQDPTYRKINPSASPILYVAVTSPTLTLGQLYDYANTLIGQRLSTIEGVSQVSVYGSPFAVRSQVDPGYLASLDVSLTDVADTLSAANQYQPLGQFDGTHSASLIYDNGGLTNAEAYAPLVVAYRNGSPIRVENVGDVLNGVQNDRSTRLFIEGDLVQPTVTLAIQRQPGANTVAVANAIKRSLKELEKNIPASIDLITIFDRSESIRQSIDEAELTLVIALFLVVFVIFLYLGKIKETIIPSLAMPLSVIGTFAIMHVLGYTIDILSVLALTLAMGFIIDDAIVVLENIVRRVEAGESPWMAALEGSKQIMFTIMSMTLSLIAVFIPLIFMGGLIGKMFREFAITLAIVTLLSGIISLTLTPMLCSLFIPVRKEMEKGRMAHLSHRVQHWMLSHYERALKRVLRRRKTVLAVGFLCVMLSVYLLKILPKDFLPEDDIGFLVGYTEAQEGTSSAQMSAYHDQVVEILRKDPAVASFSSFSSNPTFRQGIFFIRLIPREQRKAINAVIQDTYRNLSGIAGLNVYLKNLPSIDLNIGPQVRGNYQYLIHSPDSKLLYSSAQAFIEKMQSDPVFQGISTDLEIKTPQVTLDLQRDYAYTLGVDAASFERSLFLSYSQNRVSRIQTPIDQYDVILELNRDLQRSPSSLDDLYIRSSISGQLVPLRALASILEGVGPASVNHYAQFPAVTTTFNFAPGIVLSKGLEVVQKIADETLPPQLAAEFIGAAQIFQETVASLEFLLLIAIFAIYIILGILYESFIHPITILSTLPPAIVGALLTLYITGHPLSLYAYLGLILLIGIVKKNGIMMVDFALENVRVKKESPEKSIIDACLIRFRPIMMTTMAAIMGAVPIAIAVGAAAEARRPLGYVIIGGMVLSQLITLFLTPVLYLYFETLREKFRKESP